MGISVSNLACERGSTRILEGVDFDVPDGQALILRGPNGAGKTTLLRCLAGLTPPAGGTLTHDTDDVAYAAHADGLKAQLTAGENLRFWARVYGSGDIAPAADAFRLHDLVDRPAQYLSAGQKRRLALARLTLTNRPIWCLDEPTVSLDAQNVGRFADAVRAHMAGGGVALIATHIDLGLDTARVLDISQFTASADGTEHDPFLDEALS
ncbi:heme ABC exporter ATP-binding protein CcmA [Litoreibacter roseus]|uniref:Cytochrome c biogenesis ATP-binding export protein CcmA n=1 Tax=Litoreibacter roseus TaxID=2601869 RepID=A0A6N6JBJ7_9RHOB|nr:heme ABC exporter ATP-binding protein CcmA [Litoreibacter roseus]GFE63643.1 cytochrome c biogenesis ATP-binding export protein CcmA [Litoreibacter roseus]